MKFEIYDKKMKESSLNFEKYDKSPSNFEIFKVDLPDNGPKRRTVIHSFGSSFTRCQDRPICMANSSESASFGLSNSPVLGLGFLPPTPPTLYYMKGLGLLPTHENSSPVREYTQT